MQDQEILEYMRSFKELMEETLNRVDAMEDLVYKQLLEPAKQLNDEFNLSQRKKAFVDKYGDKLTPFNDKLKAIEGDTFDIVEQAFSDYDSTDRSIPEEQYVDALIAKVSAQLEKISLAFGGAKVEAVAEETKEGEAPEVEVSIEAEEANESTANEAEESPAEEANEAEEAEDIDWEAEYSKLSEKERR